MVAVPRRLFGLLFAVVGLASQLALGSVVIPDAPSADDSLAAASVVCRPGEKPSQPPTEKAPAAHPLSVALALPSVVPVPAPLLPPPAAVAIGRAASTARPRAPPPAPVLAAQPRGPPALS
jgi:hypothetical protein